MFNYIILTWILAADSVEIDTEKKKIDFAVGGQALIEGVMMRSPNHISIAVRKPDLSIERKSDPHKTLTQRYKILNLPILRGVINLFEMMYIGTKAINYSAEISLEEEPDKKSKEKSEQSESKISKFFNAAMFVFSFIFAMAFSIALFKFLPLALTSIIESNVKSVEENYIIFNLIDGALKMLIFLSYIFLLGLIPSFRRVFEYHGAEHKSIFNYESSEDLNTKNAQSKSRFHPRCGTSFILIVFVVSILVYTFVPKQELFINNLILRVAFLPFIAGIAYEYLKLSAKYAQNPIVKALIMPGLAFQRLTTKEPDNHQLEVGLESLKLALAEENNK